jgi:hypothetical protein
MRVDRNAGVIRGVKVLGIESRNGRTYLPDAIAQAVALYDGAKVNVNHPKGNPTSPRDYQDRIGTIRNAMVRVGEGVFGDFHFNPKHALAEQLMWDAEHAPENVGFSHNVEAKVSRQGDRVLIEAITRVQSVDLVADPATTRGLYEAAEDPSNEPAIASLTLEDLHHDHPDLVEQLRQEQSNEIVHLRQEIARLSALERSQQQRELARRLLREFELPDPESGDPLARRIISERFLDLLAASPDEATMRALVEERSRLVRAIAHGEASSDANDARPQSRDQLLADHTFPSDTKSFVRAIT